MILINGAKTRYVEAVKTAVKAGVNVNFKSNDDSGRTDLIWSSINGHLEMAKFLIEKGADVNTMNNLGQTALTFASRKGHVEIMKLLRQAGARE